MPNTREKLIELLDGLNLPSECDDELGWMADHLIANGVTIINEHWATEQAYKNGYEDGKPKWIPVSERLPEKFHSVLTARKIGDWFSIDMESIGANGKWLGDIFTNNEVTHWMPLPEPPKGD